MKKLNKHNYEAYFLDYIEGNLNESQVRELKKFLNSNPELKEELHDFEEFTLEPENIIYKHKEDLIQNAQAKHFEINDFEYLCVADIEKDITEEEKNRLFEKVEEDTSRIKDLGLFKKTKLFPDFNIKYPKKNQLMRRYLPAGFKTVFSVAAAVTATLLVLNISGILYRSGDQNGLLSVSGSRIHKHKPAQIQDISENTNKQEVILSHNQTIKQTNNNDLAFVDNESQNQENVYKDLTVSIPDIKNETLIFSDFKDNLVSCKMSLAQQNNKQNNKELLWQYAETGVNVWKLISSSDFEMDNIYQENGSIEKLKLTASNFRISRTFYKKQN